MIALALRFFADVFLIYISKTGAIMAAALLGVGGAWCPDVKKGKCERRKAAHRLNSWKEAIFHFERTLG